jgi:hypothetical protein
MALQLRRGTEAERASVTPLEGELIYVTDTNRLYIGGKVSPSTDLEVGGILVTGKVSEDANPQLSANLNLNGHNIVGTGNINIDGTITATGNINLGDGAEDNVIVGGQIGSSLIPGSSEVYDLGDQAGRWRDVHAVSLNAEGASINGETSVGSLVLNGDIKASDSSLIYDAATETFNAVTINAATVNADVVGNVISADSTVLVDTTSNEVYANVDNTIVTTTDISASRVVLEGINTEGNSAGLEIITTDDAEGATNFGIFGANDSEVGQSVVYSRSRGTHASPEPLQADDEISGMYWFGTDADSNSLPCAAIRVDVVDTPTSGRVPTNIVFATPDQSGNLAFALRIDENQTTSFQGAAQMASYANETARDAAIPTPVAGMVIFLQGHDDSTGLPTFQGYDGNEWRDFT